MGIMDFIKGELLEVIEWTDDSRDTLSFRFPDDDKAIKRGAQLIVRESQMVQFVYLGEFADTYGPGKHTLTTDNIPVLTKLKSWKYGFESPFKVDIYFVTTRLFTGNKWGTSNPIMMRDDDFGIVRARAFGTFDFKIVDPRLFLKEVAGSDQNFRLDEFSDAMRSRIVSIFSDALASSKVPVLDVATDTASSATRCCRSSIPVVIDEVRPRDHELHRRERVGAARGRRGDRQAVEHGRDRKSERLREVSDGQGISQPGGAGAAGMASELAVGFGIAQQLMQQSGVTQPATVPVAGGPAAAAAAPAVADLLAPADVAKALGVSEEDVMSIITSGELTAKKIGASYRIKRSALDEYLSK